MPHIHLAACSLNQTPLDWNGNFERCEKAINEARKIGVEILCLPELSLTGYGCEDMFLSPWVINRSSQLLKKLSTVCKDIYVIVGVPFMYQGSTYNCAAVLHNHKILGIIPKQYLANDGIHYESRWFSAWKGGVGQEVKLEGSHIPFGQHTFKYREVRFGIEVCEDAWVSERPAKKYLNSGADIIFNLSASHFALLRLSRRLDTGTSLGRISESVYYVYANLVGNEAGRAIYDGSSFLSRGQKILAMSPRFTFEDFELVSSIAKIDTPKSRTKKQNDIVLDTLPDEYIASAQATNCRKATFEESACLKEEEFTRAVTLGMFDYLRKSYSRGFVIPLSGGADSSACACLAKLSLSLPLLQLGRSGLHEKFALPDNFKDSLGDFLTLVYLKTKNNSRETEEAARAVAKGLTTQFESIDIDDIVSLYTSKVSSYVGYEPDWDQHGISLQNIQARARSPYVWFLANLKNALLLSTSNRSEAAVGYTTMDGDTSGGLSPIGGIDKAFLLRWLDWLSHEDNHSFGDFSFLEKVLKLSPSAELKPLTSSQTDEDDLMPYIVLDCIERGFVKDKLSIPELYALVHEKGYSESLDQAKSWVDTFVKLWRRNQWKRERYAPSFHLDEQNLDPKSWCRFPILSGEF